MLVKGATGVSRVQWGNQFYAEFHGFLYFKYMFKLQTSIDLRTISMNMQVVMDTIVIWFQLSGDNIDYKSWRVCGCLMLVMIRDLSIAQLCWDLSGENHINYSSMLCK